MRSSACRRGTPAAQAGTALVSPPHFVSGPVQCSYRSRDATCFSSTRAARRVVPAPILNAETTLPILSGLRWYCQSPAMVPSRTGPRSSLPGSVRRLGRSWSSSQRPARRRLGPRTGCRRRSRGESRPRRAHWARTGTRGWRCSAGAREHDSRRVLAQLQVDALCRGGEAALGRSSPSGSRTARVLVARTRPHRRRCSDPLVDQYAVLPTTKLEAPSKPMTRCPLPMRARDSPAGRVMRRPARTAPILRAPRKRPRVPVLREASRGTSCVGAARHRLAWAGRAEWIGRG